MVKEASADGPRIAEASVANVDAASRDANERQEKWASVSSGEANFALRNGTAALVRTSVLPESTPIRALSALLSRSFSPPATAGLGHFDPFPQPKLNGRCPFS